jgi:hypothetical protein
LSVEDVTIEGGKSVYSANHVMTYGIIIGYPGMAAQPLRVRITGHSIFGTLNGTLAMYVAGCSGLAVRSVYHPAGTGLDTTAATDKIVDGNAAIT